MTRQGDLSDTAPEAHRVRVELYRRMTPAEKARCIRQLSLAADTMALAGLRMRHPGAGNGELLLRLARLRLGTELVSRLYGWLPTDDS